MYDDVVNRLVSALALKKLVLGEHAVVVEYVESIVGVVRATIPTKEQQDLVLFGVCKGIEHAMIADAAGIPMHAFLGAMKLRYRVQLTGAAPADENGPVPSPVTSPAKKPAKKGGRR